MDSFEANKIFGAVLGAVFVLFGGSILAEGIFHSEAPEEPGYVIVAAEEPAAGEAAGEAPAAQPLPILLAAADPEAGASQFRKCTACHSAEEGGPNKVGPVLWDVVDRPVASVPGFAYSAAMQEFSQGGSVNWTFDHLSAFLEDPQEHVPGTIMGFAGIGDAADRADLLVYLRTLSANPAPLPEAPAPGAETAAAPAEGGTASPATTTAAEGQEQPQSPGTTDTETAVATPEAAATMVPATGDTAPAAPTAANDTAGAPTGGDTTAPAAEGTVPEGAEGQPAAAPAAPAPAAPAAGTPAAPAPAAGTPAAPAPQAAAPAAPAPAEDAATTAPAEGAAAGAQVAALPASADPAAGKQAFRRCMACHSAEEGGPNKIGPALYGVFGRSVASAEGYSYSPAMVEYSQGGSVVWDYDHLSTFLEDPQGVVPGTKMAFPGVKDAADRDNLIAYLQSLGGAAQ